MKKYLNSSLRVLFPETCCTNDTLTVSRLAMPPFERPPENLARRRRRGSTAATLHAAGIREVESLAQAPEALRPVAGEAAFVICAGRDWDWPAGGAGARRIGGLCDRRSAQMAGRLGAAAAEGQSLLRDDHPAVIAWVADSPAQQKVDEPAGKLLLPEGDSIDVLRVQLAVANLISASVSRRPINFDCVGMVMSALCHRACSHYAPHDNDPRFTSAPQSFDMKAKMSRL